MSDHAFGYVEELALTKLGVEELREQWAAVNKRKPAAGSILLELTELEAHLEQLEGGVDEAALSA